MAKKVSFFGRLAMVLDLVFGLVLAGCSTDSDDGGDDNGGGASVAKADLEGIWKNGDTQYTFNADSSWVGMWGETGTWSVNGSTLTITVDGKSETCTVALSSDKKTLTISQRQTSRVDEGVYTKQ